MITCEAGSAAMISNSRITTRYRQTPRTWQTESIRTTTRRWVRMAPACVLGDRDVRDGRSRPIQIARNIAGARLDAHLDDRTIRADGRKASHEEPCVARVARINAEHGRAVRRKLNEISKRDGG